MVRIGPGEIQIVPPGPPPPRPPEPLRSAQGLKGVTVAPPEERAGPAVRPEVAGAPRLASSRPSDAEPRRLGASIDVRA